MIFSLGSLLWNFYSKASIYLSNLLKINAYRIYKYNQHIHGLVNYATVKLPNHGKKSEDRCSHLNNNWWYWILFSLKERYSLQLLVYKKSLTWTWNFLPKTSRVGRKVENQLWPAGWTPSSDQKYLIYTPWVFNLT